MTPLLQQRHNLVSRELNEYTDFNLFPHRWTHMQVKPLISSMTPIVQEYKMPLMDLHSCEDLVHGFPSLFALLLNYTIRSSMLCQIQCR